MTRELALRVAGGPAQRLDQDEDSDWATLLAPSDVTFVSARHGQAPAELEGEDRGVVVVTTLPATLLDGRDAGGA